MAYTLSYSGGSFTVADGTLNISNTTLQLPGRNYAGYGGPVDQDLVWLTENFASFSGANYVNGPTNAIVGQLWFKNTASDVANLSSLQVAFPPEAGNTGVSWKQLLINSPNATGTFGRVQTNLITTGSNTTPGLFEGAWALTPGSTLTLPMGGTANFLDSTVEINDLTAGSPSANANLIGQWTLANTSSITLGNSAYIDARNGNLISNQLTTIDPAANATITGQWELQPNSAFILNESKFYFVNAANGGPGTNAIVDLRTGTTDNFFANNIKAGESVTDTANLTGQWLVTNQSNLIFGNSTILDLARNATSYANGDPIYGTSPLFTSRFLYAAADGNTQTKADIAGNWRLTAGSAFDARQGNLYSTTLNTGSPSTPGTMTGNWTINNDLTVSGILTNQNFTTGAAATAGTITGNWSLSAGSRFNATYADLGERFAADAEYEYGTVMELGGIAEVTAVRDDLSDQVFGVVSESAGYIMNGSAGGNDTHPIIAMTGRVPVKVKGSVKKFDRLVSAGNGYARSAKPEEITATNVVGRALEDKQTVGEGKVLATVSIKI